jgi:hypothetical protein
VVHSYFEEEKMAARWVPHPTERLARAYRRAQRAHDLEPSGRYERAGFAYPDGYRGAYAERPGYSTPRGQLYPEERERGGWPAPRRALDPRARARHLRAYRDRELARSIDAALYDLLGPEADQIAIYADDAEITLEGIVSHPEVARAALEVTVGTPGVHRVRDRLGWQRTAPQRYRRRPTARPDNWVTRPGYH